jgi:hypothetical protein
MGPGPSDTVDNIGDNQHNHLVPMSFFRLLLSRVYGDSNTEPADPTARCFLSNLNHRASNMDCPICGAIAERIATTIDGVSIGCPMCGEFDVASSVIASGQLQGLEMEERADVLGRAQRSAEPGARPMITPYLLA